MKKWMYLFAALTACGAEESDVAEPDGSSWIPDVVGQDFLCSTKSKCEYGLGKSLAEVLKEFYSGGRVIVNDFATIEEKNAGRILSEAMGYGGKVFYDSEVSDLWDQKTVLVGRSGNSGLIDEVLNYQDKCESDETFMYGLKLGERAMVVVVGDEVELMAKFYRDFPDLEVLSRRNLVTRRELVCDAIGAEFYEPIE